MRGSQLHRFTLEPTKKVLTLYKATHWLISSIIIQLRTSRIGLRDFLHEKKVSGFKDPQCPCGQGGRTVPYILISGRNSREATEMMWTIEREYRFGIHYKSREVIGLRILLTVPNYAVNPAKFILETGILGQFRSKHPVQ